MSKFLNSLKLYLPLLGGRLGEGGTDEPNENSRHPLGGRGQATDLVAAALLHSVGSNPALSSLGQSSMY